MFCCCAGGGSKIKPEDAASPTAEEPEPVPAAPAEEPEPSEPLHEVKPAELEPATESAPERPKPIFECTLERSNGKFGITCDQWAECIQVVGVCDGGSIEIYNANAPEYRRVYKHDFITRVNGERSAEKMQALLQRECTVTLQIARPIRRRIKVAKAEHKGHVWGLKLGCQSRTSTCLRVLEVKQGGVFRSYNTSASSVDRINVEDFIEKVNGLSKSSKQMLEELQIAHSVELVLLKLPEGCLTE